MHFKYVINSNVGLVARLTHFELEIITQMGLYTT